MQTVDYDAIEAKMEELAVLEVALKEAIGTEGEASARKALKQAISEINVMMP